MFTKIHIKQSATSPSMFHFTWRDKEGDKDTVLVTPAFLSTNLSAQLGYLYSLANTELASRYKIGSYDPVFFDYGEMDTPLLESVFAVLEKLCRNPSLLLNHKVYVNTVEIADD